MKMLVDGKIVDMTPEQEKAFVAQSKIDAAAPTMPSPFERIVALRTAFKAAGTQAAKLAVLAEALGLDKDPVP